MRSRGHWRVACALFTLALACYGAPRETTAPSSVPVSHYQPLSTFPPPGPALPVERGVVVHSVSLAHGNQAGRIWIYLPAKTPAKPLPCVFIAPAGVPPYIGNSFGPDLDRQGHPEHLPYLHSGFAVVAYDVDGEIADRDNATYEQVQAAATAFKEADAGMVNARHAIDYVVKMVPAIDPARLYSAGHSSAGRLSLLLAESDPRIKGCIAYAPVTDPERRMQQVAAEAGRYLESNVAGFGDFLKSSSPLRQVGQLRCPVFIYHSSGDHRIPLADTAAFVDTLTKTNTRVLFVRGTRGDHFDSMINEGMPLALRWLRDLARH